MNTIRRSNCSRRANLVLFLFRFRVAACCFPPLCFSLCHCHEDKVDRSLDKAEKSYHDGRHSSPMQEKTLPGISARSPSPSLPPLPFLCSLWNTRYYWLSNLLPPSRSIIPVELGAGSDRLRSIQDRGDRYQPAETVHVPPLVCEMAGRRDLISDSVFMVPLLRWNRQDTYAIHELSRK